MIKWSWQQHILQKMTSVHKSDILMFFQVAEQWLKRRPFSNAGVSVLVRHGYSANIVWINQGIINELFDLMHLQARQKWFLPF